MFCSLGKSKNFGIVDKTKAWEQFLRTCLKFKLHQKFKTERYSAYLLMLVKKHLQHDISQRV